MAIQLDEATLIALVTESLFFGIFTVLFSISLYILILRKRRGSSRVNRPLISVSILMYVLAFVHMCISAQRVMIAFLRKEGKPGEASEWLSSTSNPLYLTQVGIYIAQTLVGDSFMAFRLYVVWGRDKRFLCAALVCLIAILGVAEANAVLAVSNTSIFIPRLKHWILAFFCLTLSTNLICTALIAYRIWSIEHRLNNAIKSQGLSPALSVIIESSAIYTLGLTLLTCFFAIGTNAQYIILNIMVPIVGITFTLIIVRIGLGLSHGASMSTQSGRLSQRVVELGYGSGQNIPMHPLVVQIEQSRIITDDAHNSKDVHDSKDAPRPVSHGSV